MLSHVQLCVTPWTVAHQVPLSIGFSWQEYRGGLPCPPPGDLPHPGIEPMSHLLHWQECSLPLSHWGIPQYCTNSPLKIIEISIIVRINIGFEF